MLTSRTLFAALATLVALSGCDTPDGTPVRASLADGQVILGQVQTDVLRLESGLGLLAIPLADVGEVVPVEGDRLSDSNDHVTVWLRDGSELRGRWDEPELRIALDVGGERVPIDLPMDFLVRTQLQSGLLMPEGDVFRVQTTFGDDFLVDAEATRVVIDNELGVFSPFLSECRSVRPVADPEGDWRVELTNGSVLIGPLADKGFDFSMTIGPDQVSVDLDQLVSLERESWATTDTLYRSISAARKSDGSRNSRGGDTGGWEHQAAEQAAPADGDLFMSPGAGSTAGPLHQPVDLVPVEAAPMPSPAGWYDRSVFESAKRR